MPDELTPRVPQECWYCGKPVEAWKYNSYKFDCSCGCGWRSDPIQKRIMPVVERTHP